MRLCKMALGRKEARKQAWKGGGRTKGILDWMVAKVTIVSAGEIYAVREMGFF